MHTYKFSVTAHIKSREGGQSIDKEIPIEVSVTAESARDAHSALFVLMKGAYLLWGEDKLVWSDDPKAEVR